MAVLVPFEAFSTSDLLTVTLRALGSGTEIQSVSHRPPPLPPLLQGVEASRDARRVNECGCAPLELYF